MEHGNTIGYLDTALSEDRWQGWYITREKDRILRLCRSGMEVRSPGKIPVDYRMYCIDSGRIDCSGICCDGMGDTIRGLHGKLTELCECTGISFKMCGLGHGLFSDCLENAYLKRNTNELQKASRMITCHFC